MNKKSQVQAIREVFQFLIGIVLLISTYYMFYNAIIPTVAEYSLELEVENINSHFNYLLSNLLSIVDSSFVQGIIELDYELPNKIGDYAYTSFFSEDEFCTLINGLTIKKCTEFDLMGVSAEGFYLSSGDLKVIVNKTSTSTSLVISN